MEKLKNLRKEKGLSQAELAKKLNMSFRGYQNIEYGICQTSYENLIKISDFFGCSVDYLLGHQTKEILHRDSFTHDQQVAIDLIKKLDEKEVVLLLGYLARMTDTPLEQILGEKKETSSNFIN